MQLDGGRRGGAQHILEWGVFGLVFRRKAGFLLLKDRQSQHVAERERGQTEDRKHTNEHADGQKSKAEPQKLCLRSDLEQIWGVSDLIHKSDILKKNTHTHPTF